jgi:predicted nucleotidyltransferase
MGQLAEGEAMIQLEQHRHAILEAAARHGARNVRVFGSAARGDDRMDSDIDLLVEMADDRSLLDLVALELELESLLNRPVDVLTTQSLAPAIRERVAADARAL